MAQREDGRSRSGASGSAPFRRLFREIAVPIALLVLADFAFRFFSQSPSIPLPNLLNSPVASGKYLAYRRLAGDDQPLDVLLMGQSQMLRASMGIVRETVARETGREILGFNFAGPQQSIEFDRRLLEDVLVPIKAPRLVVLGLLPQNLVFEQDRSNVDEMTRQLPAFTMHAGTPEARVEELLFRYSELFRYRGAIHDVLLGRGQQIPFWVELGRSVDRYGDVPIATPVRKVWKLDAWELNYVQQFKAFDDLMRNTDLFDHISDLARTCRAHGIRLVLMTNAMHPIALQELPNGEEDMMHFIAAVHAMADAQHIPVLNAAPGGIGPPEMFSDAAHTNAAGSRWMSEQIGHFLVEQGLLHEAPVAGPTPMAGA